MFLRPIFPSGHTVGTAAVAEGLMAGNIRCLLEWQATCFFLPTLPTNSMAKVCLWWCVCDSFDDIVKNVYCPSFWRLSPLLVLRKQVATLESSMWQGTESGFENQRGASSQWPVKVSASIQQEKEFLSSAITRKWILPTVWVILEEDPSPVEPQMWL